MTLVAPSVPAYARLVRADNPSPMTLEGTNTWVLRAHDETGSIVIDPGPLSDQHLDAVVETAGPVALILLTHGHPDHSDGARALQWATGAPMAAVDPRFCHGSEPLRGDTRFEGVGGLDLAVLSTPGHTSDSVSFVVRGESPAVLTGDTILGRGTTVVAHPDGLLRDYLASLSALRNLAGPIALLPGHGPAGGEATERAAAYLVHRAQRLDQVRAALAAGDVTPEQVVRRVYADLDTDLWPAAELSVQAQLEYLREQA